MEYNIRNEGERLADALTLAALNGIRRKVERALNRSKVPPENVRTFKRALAVLDEDAMSVWIRLDCDDPHACPR